MSNRVLFTVAALTFILVAALLARPARAQVLCGKWQEIRSMLADRFGEVPVGGGAAPSGSSAIEVFVSPGGETFSLVQVGRTGTACLLAVGVGWATSAPPVKDEIDG